MMKDDKIFFLNKMRKFNKKRKKDNSYLSYMRGIMNGWKENKILPFPLHKIIIKRKRNNNDGY